MRGWRSSGRMATAALLALALTGCWPWPGQNPDRTAYNPVETRISPQTVGGLTRSWEAALDPGQPGPPVVSTSRVHVVSGRTVYGIDTRTGARAWTASALRHPDGYPEFASPDAFVDGGRLLVTGGGAALGTGWSYTLSFDPATGALLASSDTGAGRVGARRGTRSVGNFFARGTGTPVLYYLAEQVGDVATVRKVLNVDGGDTAFTLGPDRIYASGESLLPPVLATGVPTVYDTIGPGVRAYPFGTQSAWCTTDEFAPYQLQLECPTWVAPLDGTTATVPVLAPDRSAVYAGTAGGHVYALDPGTGTVLWSASLGAAVAAAPALAGTTLYVPTADGDLAALAAGGCGHPQCPPLWRAGTGGPPSAQPAVAGGVVFTATTGGALRAFDAAGCGAARCRSLWADELGSGVTAAPAVTGGRLYVGTADARLVSYALPG